MTQLQHVTDAIIASEGHDRRATQGLWRGRMSIHISSAHRDQQEDLSKWDVEHLIRWMWEKPRRPAYLAFTAGGKRQVAYAIEELLEREKAR